MQAKKDIKNTKSIPKHIAIIMDGNGRWARKQGFIRSIGHENGVDALRRIATASAELGIQYLTVYAFSTENWSRPRSEVKALMSLLVSSLKKETKTLMDNEIRLHSIGDTRLLPKRCQRELGEVIEQTKGNKRMTLTLALSYSSRDEIVQCMRKLGEQVRDGLIRAEDINETLVSKNLYTCNIPDPDLLIRTSGEKRISNYLLWQLAYTELYFSDKLWPEFTKEDLIDALEEYQKRERRFGKTSEQIISEDER